MMIYCKGEQCSVKNTCERYTKRDKNSSDGVIRKCTSQKRYVQDADKVNDDGKRT